MFQKKTNGDIACPLEKSWLGGVGGGGGFCVSLLLPKESNVNACFSYTNGAGIAPIELNERPNISAAKSIAAADVLI